MIGRVRRKTTPGNFGRGGASDDGAHGHWHPARSPLQWRGKGSAFAGRRSTWQVCCGDLQGPRMLALDKRGRDGRQVTACRAAHSRWRSSSRRHKAPEPIRAGDGLDTLIS